MDKEHWRRKLDDAASKYGFIEGYKLLYCPWKTIDNSTVAFISLNPGSMPDDKERNVVSEERGNSYLIEQKCTKSPITSQFLKMAEFLAVKPESILTGVIHPFRSRKWKDFSKEQQEIGLRIGAEFCLTAFSSDIKTIVVVGNATFNQVSTLTNSKIIDSIFSGWGKCQLQRHKTETGSNLIKLPHLSSYKLFSRSECREPLSKIFQLKKI